MKKDIILVPNLLSIFRFLLIPLIAFFLIYHPQETIIITLLLVLSFLSDILDGWIARKFNQVSELGKIIDPLADKFTVIVIATILFLYNRIPTWFFLVVVARDLLILLFGLILRKIRGITLMSNYPGKIAVFGIGLILLLTIINGENYELLFYVVSLLYYIVTVLILYSSLLYFLRFLETIRRTSNG
jgi:cardiolipin synthase